MNCHPNEAYDPLFALYLLGIHINRIYFFYSLDLYIWVYCGANSYGRDCTVYCVPKDNDSEGHYGCDLRTGEKYCLDGEYN